MLRLWPPRRGVWELRPVREAPAKPRGPGGLAPHLCSEGTGLELLSWTKRGSEAVGRTRVGVFSCSWWLCL